MSLTVEPVSPKATPLPPLPPDDVLNPAQWKTFLAIVDAIIPAIRPHSTADAHLEIAVSDNDYSKSISTLQGISAEADSDVLVANYLAESASSNPALRESFYRMLALYMRPSMRKDLTFVLNLLGTRAGSLLLTGFITPIADQSVHVRETILKGWKIARLPLLRQLYATFTALSKRLWILTTPTLLRILGVPRVPVGMKPGNGFEFEFIQFPPGDEIATIETDVVVVGSGCGGGVCAKNLAESGHRVIVVEKSYHWTPEHLPMREADGLNHLFINGGVITSDDASISIVAGQAWGGGGTVNWSACLQTQAFVRKEWADSGLPFFTSAEFQQSLDRVCARMGVSADHIEQTRSNQILMEGARKLGYTHKPVPQNTGGNPHRCGHCSFGCGSCEKQGPVVSFLPDAARSGADFIEGFQADRILFSSAQGDKVAIGVEGTWTSRDINGGVAGEPTVRRKVIIKAKRVIVSSGTMQSPLLLLRSGLRNYHIGRNLHIHPAGGVGAIFDEEIKPWEGAILTSVVSEFENMDGKGHGVKIEATNMMPSLWLVFLQWEDGLQYKLQAARMRNMIGHVVIVRERDGGQVYPDPIDGQVRVKYTTSGFDKKSMMDGMVAAAKIQYVEGAREIFVPTPGVPTFVRDAATSSDTGINDAKFQAWLEKMKSVGFPTPGTFFASAHQMGTCRMSASAKAGVVDPQGQVWGTKNLYIADASVFPSASGVNPMVTNMAISDWISRGVSKGLGERSKL
ncbi:long-chain fatty alcohol dehydrogenase [Lophiostoma macrostomum CBS 122681]|uniref:Long-chain-alcohol oxidase n=1 Tax=Lophiostoma macrostomum CBS 122681 TaxID=1314788 RepID=A0A6A6TJ90_9PLEO|nr:long-chain fatty alcohol dehydrogenase [Lophiostoma macrostomum CBS 122681]